MTEQSYRSPIERVPLTIGGSWLVSGVGRHVVALDVAEYERLRDEVERLRVVADAARAYHHWWSEGADDGKGEGMRLWLILCRALADDGSAG